MEGGLTMRIGFIGAGKVATAFGRYLHGKGLTVSGYYDRHADKATHASQRTESRACGSAAEIAQTSDMILITTRDDQIQTACKALAREAVLGPDHLVGHMSGAHASLILSDAAAQGAAVFSLHPLQAFAEEHKAVADLEATYFSIEGTDDRLTVIESMLDRTGNRYFRIEPQHKQIYHLAACILSNYLVTLMHMGMTALEKSGIDPAEGFNAMRPLIEGTLANIAQIGPARALTGPIARGDATTISRHLEALDAQRLDDLKRSYLFLGQKTLELATQAVLKEPELSDALAQILKK
jgi:predicted short-subunit dehydrogenase-like oxidoreductase (DUF2520 family)